MLFFMAVLSATATAVLSATATAKPDPNCVNMPDAELKATMIKYGVEGISSCKQYTQALTAFGVTCENANEWFNSMSQTSVMGGKVMNELDKNNDGDLQKNEANPYMYCCDECKKLKSNSALSDLSYRYIGCYYDGAGGDDMHYGPKSGGYNQASCQKKCARYRYFALHDNGHCMCDNDFASPPAQYPAVSDNLCGPPYYRGGKFQNAVYATSKEYLRCTDHTCVNTPTCTDKQDKDFDKAMEKFGIHHIDNCDQYIDTLKAAGVNCKNANAWFNNVAKTSELSGAVMSFLDKNKDGILSEAEANPYQYCCASCKRLDAAPSSGNRPWKYIGCYHDDGFVDIRYGPKKSGYDQASCRQACARYKFFALQAGGRCTCDNDYATPATAYPKIDDNLCGPKFLGGKNANAVYSTSGYIKPPAAPVCADMNDADLDAAMESLNVRWINSCKDYATSLQNLGVNCKNAMAWFNRASTTSNLAADVTFALDKNGDGKTQDSEGNPYQFCCKTCQSLDRKGGSGNLPYKYLGCYHDDGSDLRHGPRKSGFDQKSCQQACSKYKYFALTQNGFCSCDNDYATPIDQHPRVDDNLCGSNYRGGLDSSAVYTKTSLFNSGQPTCSDTPKEMLAPQMAKYGLPQVKTCTDYVRALQEFGVNCRNANEWFNGDNVAATSTAGAKWKSIFDKNHDGIVEMGESNPFQICCASCQNLDKKKTSGTESFKYIGCYKETKVGGDLRQGPKHGTYSQASCDSACSRFKYFALHNNGICTCDNDYATPKNAFPRVDDAQCGTYFRGGKTTNAVYSTSGSISSGPPICRDMLQFEFNAAMEKFGIHNINSCADYTRTLQDMGINCRQANGWFNNMAKTSELGSAIMNDLDKNGNERLDFAEGNPYQYCCQSCRKLDHNPTSGKKPYRYVGCYHDASYGDLRHGPRKYGYDQTSCYNACKNYKFFALQNNGMCVCDNDFSTPADKFPAVDDNLCGPDFKGGKDANAVYTHAGTDGSFKGEVGTVSGTDSGTVFKGFRR